MGASPQQQGLPQPPLQLDPPRDARWIGLPRPTETKFPALDLRKAIEQRVSVRQYSPEPLALDELSMLLWLTQGVKETTRVSGLAAGLYRFMAHEHALIEVNLTPDIASRLEEACLGQKMITTCAAAFFWTAVVERMTWRYAERGYRYLHLDAGHACQNLYLAGEALGCGTCAIGAYEDDTLNELLGLDGKERLVIYLATLGKKRNK
jgi:SagB-type dehydrogenase family enzyme